MTYSAKKPKKSKPIALPAARAEWREKKVGLTLRVPSRLKSTRTLLASLQTALRQSVRL